uniref:Uncharacterized protein n=1 Tax=Meloidogyne enterolobii TaxID=390850 RepID=A0A6V7W9Z2_MELEN|nr:unnamed protein product [Meloidogyne enterolobii]
MCTYPVLSIRCFGAFMDKNVLFFQFNLVFLILPFFDILWAFGLIAILWNAIICNRHFMGEPIKT